MEVLVAILIFINLILILNILKNKDEVGSKEQIVYNLDIESITKKMEEIPNKVLQSITNSSNTNKGALGELIGYLNLRSSYDRIIPLGNIVDFMCIKFPTDTEEGCVDFIDIKTGNKSRLSKDQNALQKLIENKQINFLKIKVNTSSNDNTISRDQDS